MYRKIMALSLCLLMFCLVGCKSKKDKAGENNNSSINASVSEKTLYVNNLTGEEVLKSKKAAQKRPVAVMVNNVSIAQKVQTGLCDADIVYETEVEGGITRLLAVYKDISKVEKVGTVRSSRYVYIDLAMGHDAVYVHHGQDPKYAKPHLRDTQTMTLSKNNAGERIKNEGLASEHTLYGYGDKIWQWLKDKEYDLTIKNPENWQKFAAKDEVVSFDKTADIVSVPFSRQYVSVFKLDVESGKYVRHFGETERTDYYSGKKEYFKNIFVLKTNISNYPDGKHKKVDLTKGDGYYCVNGTYTPIKWEKGDSANGFKFTTVEGEPLVVSQGNSWVCLHDDSFEPTFE